MVRAATIPVFPCHRSQGVLLPNPWAIRWTPWVRVQGIACASCCRRLCYRRSPGHTRNGTPIDLFDRIGIQRDESASNMTLEATFGPDGVVCVAHTRLSDVLSATISRLADHPGSAATISRWPTILQLTVPSPRQPCFLFARSLDECGRYDRKFGDGGLSSPEVLGKSGLTMDFPIAGLPP